MSTSSLTLPKILSKSFSGLISTQISEEETVLLESNLTRFRGNREFFLDTAVKENPRLKASFVKHMMAMFDDPDHKDDVEKRVDVVLQLLHHSHYPSEIEDGLCFVNKCVGNLPLREQASGRDANDIRVLLASTMVVLMEKLTNLEVGKAKILKAKREVVRAMAFLVLTSTSFGSDSTKSILTFLKSICNFENGGDLFALLCKQDDYEEPVIDDFWVKGGKKMDITEFLTNWSSSGQFHDKINFQGDWIFMVELLQSYLNNMSIVFDRVYGRNSKSVAHVYGEATNGSSILLKINDEGLVEIKARIKTVSDKVVGIISKIKTKMVKGQLIS